MLNKEKAISCINSAINLLEASRKWGDKANIKAQKLGLQGEKRRERHESRKDHMLIQHLQCLAVDLFDVEVYPSAEVGTFPAVADIASYFDVCLNKVKQTYEELHKIANELVVIGYKPISGCLYSYVDCLFDEIVELKRTIKQGDMANWEYYYVSRYQIENKNVHDHFEEVEKKEGYKY